uniref:Uncharacterized protein n=1 Tax=Oryza barthii TaxID=65489 RepID=A0A0D3FHN8_9ORYZ
MVHCPDWWKSTTPPRAAQALPLLAPSRGAAAGASHRIRPRRRLLSPQMSPPPTPHVGSARAVSPDLRAPHPFVPRCRRLLPSSHGARPRRSLLFSPRQVI